MATVTITCLACHKTIEIPFNRRAKRFCSRKCAKSVTKKPPSLILTCPTCSGLFAVRDWKRKRGQRIYCSQSCARQPKILSKHPRWKGGRCLDTSGYVLVSVGDGEQIREHILIAEKALGKPLPDGVVVHHHDGDRSNNDPSNLVICENNAYHMLLHKRQRVLDAGGDPNTHKLCWCCKRALPFERFSTTTKTGDGLSGQCRECTNVRRRASWRLREPQ